MFRIEGLHFCFVLGLTFRDHGIGSGVYFLPSRVEGLSCRV